MSDVAEAYSKAEIAEAREALRLYPSNSPFWDSRRGQDVLQVVVDLDLIPATFR